MGSAVDQFSFHYFLKKNMSLNPLKLPKNHFTINFFFQFLAEGQDPPQLGSWTEGNIELQSSLEEPFFNCQMTHILQKLFHMTYRTFFVFFSTKGGAWVGSDP